MPSHLLVGRSDCEADLLVFHLFQRSLVRLSPLAQDMLLDEIDCCGQCQLSVVKSWRSTHSYLVGLIA